MTRDSDLCKAVARAVRELGEREGSELRAVERHLRRAYRLSVDEGADLPRLLRQAAKRAVARGLVSQVGRLFKAADRPPVSGARSKIKRRRNEDAELQVSFSLFVSAHIECFSRSYISFIICRLRWRRDLCLYVASVSVLTPETPPALPSGSIVAPGARLMYTCRA